MDSSRFWNSVRSLEDWRRTRDLWDRGRMVAYDPEPGRYVYARGDGTRAYQPSKVASFVRDLLWLPASDVLFVLDHVTSRDAAYKKAWLLHGVAAPTVTDAPGLTAQPVGQGGTLHRDAPTVTFEDGEGRLRVHSLLPREREVVVRGGPGFDFWTPGDEWGGAWGTGKNWPLDPPAGGPLPTDPYLKKMWLTFWGGDMARLSPSNRRAVVPGGWRIEVSPSQAEREDVFLHALEIGDKDAPPHRLEAAFGHGLSGAVVEGDAAVLFATTAGPPSAAEVTLPDVASRLLLVAGLEPGSSYDLQLTWNFAPGSPLWRQTVAANDAGIVAVPWAQKDGRLRLRKMEEAPR